MVKAIALLGLLVVAVPAFGAEVDTATEATLPALEVDLSLEAFEVESGAEDVDLMLPEEQMASGGYCLHSAIDCPSSTGGCGGRPFFASCDGGGVCYEACDSWESGGTTCECFNSTAIGWSTGDSQLALLLVNEHELPKCKRSSDVADAQ